MTSAFQNPVVRGHAPDPSVIRVGADFYLANSSFRFLPGIPIRHSTDLVHWSTIGFAVSRPSQYRRDGKPGPVNLFAPTLRFHDGTFYLICTNQADDQGNFYVTATDPAGPWSDAVWVDREAFDPSLFRDEDGQWYYTRRTLQFGSPDNALGPIVQATIDITTGVLGELRPITADRRGFASNDIEGPHLYRRGDWYYLFAAEGSSWKGHMQTIGRSRSPWGPFEPAPHNPVLTHRDHVAHPFQTIGHAELVDDADGRWWALALGTRHPAFSSHHTLGRETFLIPARWDEDDWPHIGDHGHVATGYDDIALPASGPTRPEPAPLSWEAGWRTLGDPEDVEHAEDGTVVLAAGADLTDPTPSGMLLLPQDEYDQGFEAVVEVTDTARSGIAVWANSTHHYSAVIRRSGDAVVVDFHKVVDDIVVEQSVTLDGSVTTVTLAIEADATTYRFLARTREGATLLGSGAARLLSAEHIQWFTNVNFALVAVAIDDASTPVRFSSVHRTDLTAPPPHYFGIPE
jgi:xylan 1,4-beta-xylosidase